MYAPSQCLVLFNICYLSLFLCDVTVKGSMNTWLRARDDLCKSQSHWNISSNGRASFSNSLKSSFLNFQESKTQSSSTCISMRIGATADNFEPDTAKDTGLLSLIKSRVNKSWMRLNLAFKSPNMSFLSCAAYVLKLLAAYAVICLPIGLQTGFLTFSWPEAPLRSIAKIMITCLFLPAISEESIFRVMLLPHRNENPSRFELTVSNILSLALFIVYHPLNALTVFPAGYPTFLNPVFLFQAGVLGIICSMSYNKTGSIWPSVFIHWFLVINWQIFFGGRDRLHI